MQYAEKLNADKLKKVIHGLSGACLPRLLAPAAWRATTHPSCMLLLCAACGSLPVKTEGQEPPCWACTFADHAKPCCAGGRFGKQYFNMRLAPEEVSNALSGYQHNAGGASACLRVKGVVAPAPLQPCCSPPSSHPPHVAYWPWAHA